METGPLQENTYIIYEGENAIIVDPGDNAPDLLGLIRSHGLTPVLILLTHAHADHTGAVQALQNDFQTPIAVHEADNGLLKGNVPDVLKVRYLQGREILEGYGFDIEVIPTPGHTAGSVCYLINGVLFSGDTLFRGTIGRTDFPESSWPDMERSLEILRTLPGTTKVFPGHGPSTTIDAERATNPWMR